MDVFLHMSYKTIGNLTEDTQDMFVLVWDLWALLKNGNLTGLAFGDTLVSSTLFIKHSLSC